MKKLIYIYQLFVPVHVCCCCWIASSESKISHWSSEIEIIVKTMGSYGLRSVSGKHGRLAWYFNGKRSIIMASLPGANFLLIHTHDAASACNEMFATKLKSLETYHPKHDFISKVNTSFTFCFDRIYEPYSWNSNPEIFQLFTLPFMLPLLESLFSIISKIRWEHTDYVEIKHWMNALFGYIDKTFLQYTNGHIL